MHARRPQHIVLKWTNHVILNRLKWKARGKTQINVATTQIHVETTTHIYVEKVKISGGIIFVQTSPPLHMAYIFVQTSAHMLNQDYVGLKSSEPTKRPRQHDTHSPKMAHVLSQYIYIYIYTIVSSQELMVSEVVDTIMLTRADC